MRSFFLITSLLCIILVARAEAKEIYPYACKPFVIHDETVTLPAKKPRLIMLHNLSNADLWITHPMSEQDTFQSFSTRLQSNHWSALALDDNMFELNCIESKPGHEQQVPCAQTLAMCEWPLTNPDNTQVPVWAAEDMPLTTLTAYMSRHGFELPQKAQ
jgi:hypothetical protein